MLPITIVDKFDKIKTSYDENKIRKVQIKDLDMELYNQRQKSTDKSVGFMRTAPLAPAILDSSRGLP